ncbi:helix-turn-helix transcriptional regulator [Aliikangiella sp. IMCC44653]
MPKETSQTNQWPYRWDLLLKYRLIEILSLWEGRLTSKALMQAFGIGRQQASKHINQYIKEVAPNNLVYDQVIKGYRPTAAFNSVVTQGDINEYLQLLSFQQDLLSNIHSLELSQAQTVTIQPLIRNIDPTFVRPIIQAAKDKKRVEIQYSSLTQPEPRDRMIAPHTLVFNGYRWHVRAFCEESLQFKDFLLSRMTDIAEITLDATLTEQDDTDWNTFVDIIITPDPRLSNAQKVIIEKDFAMQQGQLVINTRATLITYYLQLLRIDTAMPHSNPKAQQIVLANRESLSKWLLPD